MLFAFVFKVMRSGQKGQFNFLLLGKGQVTGHLFMAIHWKWLIATETSDGPGSEIFDLGWVNFLLLGLVWVSVWKISPNHKFFNFFPSGQKLFGQVKDESASYLLRVKSMLGWVGPISSFLAIVSTACIWKWDHNKNDSFVSCDWFYIFYSF